MKGVGYMVIIFSMLSFIFFILFIIKSRKYKKLKNKIEITDSEFLINSIRLYGVLKSNSLKADSTELRNILYDYFTDYDILYNDYFYPRYYGVENEDK